MTPQDFFASVQQVRKILEPEIAALAALNHSPAQLRAISDALVEMQSAKSGRESVGPDVKFHLALLAAANNPLLSPFGVMIETALTSMFETTSTSATGTDIFVPQHEVILKAVARGNDAAARKAMIVLLENTDKIIADSAAAAKSKKSRKS